MMPEVTDDDLKRTALRWVRHQPFLHLLLLSIIASVVYLAYIDKPAIIPDVLKVGCYSVVVTLIGVASTWMAPRIQAVVESIPMMMAAYDRLATSHETLQTSFYVLQRFVASTQADRVRANTLVLLVEDSSVEARLIRGICADLVAEFHLSFRDVGSLGEAFSHLPNACVAVIDVMLPDNEDPKSVSVLIDLAGCPVIVHSSTKFTSDDFPRAFAVLQKGSDDQYELLRDAMRRAIASTRFPG